MSAQTFYRIERSSCFNPYHALGSLGRYLLLTRPPKLAMVSLFSVLIWAYSASVVMADLVLSAPPRESAEAGAKVYNPLAQALSKITGEKVVYKHPTDWKDYERKMKNDSYDFIFDGPHFAAWRIDSLRATPLLRLPGSLEFVLVTIRTARSIQQPKDLIGHKICTLPSPNLGALSVFSMFPNPARQPEYHLVSGGFKEIALAMKNNECDAAIFRTSYYQKKTSPMFRSQTRVIQHSEAMINQGITVSQRINPKLHNKIVKALTGSTGKVAMQAIFKRFHTKNGEIVRSSKRDYRNQNLLKDNVIYGW
ncbi:MAG: phosphate/phosphite/phosphonate ABC transporter substrate-binding protein [Thiohalomonadales bacterium]